MSGRVRPSRRGLRAAYELGRRAMQQELSLLDLAQIHHVHLLQFLKTSRTETDLDDVAQPASVFFVEVLTTFEMTPGVHRAAAVKCRAARPGESGASSAATLNPEESRGA